MIALKCFSPTEKANIRFKAKTPFVAYKSIFLHYAITTGFDKIRGIQFASFQQ